LHKTFDLLLDCMGEVVQALTTTAHGDKRLQVAGEEAEDYYDCHCYCGYAEVILEDGWKVTLKSTKPSLENSSNEAWTCHRRMVRKQAWRVPRGRSHFTTYDELFSRAFVCICDLVACLRTPSSDCSCVFCSLNHLVTHCSISTYTRS